jgi:predicted RNase H-like HicB family nuclease
VDASEGVLFIARVREVPWIRAHGSTREEALLRLDQLFDDAIQAMIDAGDDIPVPAQWPAPYLNPPRRLLRRRQPEESASVQSAPVQKEAPQVEPWTPASELETATIG